MNIIDATGLSILVTSFVGGYDKNCPKYSDKTVMKIPDNVDELFEGKIGSLNSHVKRKEAIADSDRYSALYHVYQSNDEVFRHELQCDDLKILFDTNLLARVPQPDGRERVRITMLGKDEIEKDLQILIENND